MEDEEKEKFIPTGPRSISVLCISFVLLFNNVRHDSIAELLLTVNSDFKHSAYFLVTRIPQLSVKLLEN